jgi:hypothetical protein
MKRKTLCLLLLSFWVVSLSAQLEMKRNFREAYENGTRSLDGKPGENYWQNEASYTIEASLDPENRVVSGSEAIAYTNNSPDSLGRIVIRLYQDIFKKGNARDWRVPEDDLTDGMQLSRVTVNGEEIDVSNPSGMPARYSRGPAPLVRRTGTNLYLRLTEKLAPGKSLKMEIDWNFIIPKGNRLRMGTYGPASFHVAYWYPQVAVYDDIDGWDTHNYLGTVEMYNDFSNFDVTLTLPDSVMAWATGVLQNPEQVLAKTQLKRFKKAQSSDEVVRIVTAEDQAAGGFLKEGKDGKLQWHFVAENVPDFAFATSARYLWDGCSVEVEKGRRVFVDAAYRPKGSFYDQAAEVARLVVKDLSEEIPGVPYPFPCVTVFNGSGGMEFPMIVNDGPVNSYFGLVTLTYHEIAHSYFPFYMGINERKYAWMDEGWAQILPFDLSNTLVPNAPNSMTWVALSYASVAGTDTEQPLMTPSFLTAAEGYGVHAYSKPGLAYHFLRDMLGDETYKAALQEYIRRWNGKHPIPYDFFNTINDATGKNLDWYWKAWFFETREPDLALSETRVKDNQVQTTVVNRGGLPVPIHLTVTFADGSSEEMHHSAMVWEQGDTFEVKKKFDKEVVRVAVGAGDIPETRRQDNKFEVE